jgi:molecular chaperone GrpE
MDDQQDRDPIVEGGNSETGEASDLERELQESRDQLLRRTAEMENMRRRHQQEREQWVLESNRNLILAMLPTIDDLERTLEHAHEAKDPLTQGIELVYKNFLKTLERFGVRPMDVAGRAFDPQQHDALMQEPRNDVEPGTVTREIQKGYMLGDKVLRHAKVFVAQPVEENQ